MEFVIKSMTRGQVKALRIAGLNPVINRNEWTAEMNEELVDWVFANIYPEVDVDAMDNDKAVEIAGETVKRAYGFKEAEVKNS